MQDESSECYAESFEEYAEDDNVQSTTAGHGFDVSNGNAHGSIEGGSARLRGNDDTKERTPLPLQQPQERSASLESYGSGDNTNGQRENPDISGEISKPPPEISGLQPEMDTPGEVAEGESDGVAPVSGVRC